MGSYAGTVYNVPCIYQVYLSFVGYGNEDRGGLDFQYNLYLLLVVNAMLLIIIDIKNLIKIDWAAQNCILKLDKIFAPVSHLVTLVKPLRTPHTLHARVESGASVLGLAERFVTLSPISTDPHWVSSVPKFLKVPILSSVLSHVLVSYS